MNIEQGITRALVSRYGLMPDEAEVLVSKHRALIVDATIYQNAERIVAAEVASFPSPTVEPIEAAIPEPEAPQVKSKSMTELLKLSAELATSLNAHDPKSKAQQHLKPFIRLGDQLVPLHSDKEVKQMKREGYEIVMQ